MKHLPTRQDFKHWTTLDVRWSEIDAYGHVNNVAYFSYFEAARTRYILETSNHDSLTGKSAWQVIVNCTMNFRREVRFPSTLDIGLAVTEIGKTSYVMQCAMFLAGSETLVADGTGKLVTLDPATKRPMAVPEEFIRAFEQMEQRSLAQHSVAQRPLQATL
ncbi:MAG: acyl-CoA thioesterase [Candidatus Kapabacteria bacterium]|nr:acyl-CoA thioesterase [Candidatus Kapabacteria bacterium]